MVLHRIFCCQELPSAVSGSGFQASIAPSPSPFTSPSTSSHPPSYILFFAHILHSHQHTTMPPRKRKASTTAMAATPNTPPDKKVKATGTTGQTGIRAKLTGLTSAMTSLTSTSLVSRAKTSKSSGKSHQSKPAGFVAYTSLNLQC